jgi:hypothetical protein
MLMGASNTTMVETGIVTGAADGIFIATCFGIGAIGLFIGGTWALFTATFAIAATSISWTAVARSRRLSSS